MSVLSTQITKVEYIGVLIPYEMNESTKENWFDDDILFCNSLSKYKKYCKTEMI